MSKTQSLQFVRHPHPSPVAADQRAALLKNPGFGRVFSDHMVTIRYHESQGWHDARIEPRAPIPMDPAAAVLHYAQEVFEGLKAYRTADGGATLFRPQENARRFQKSAERLAMPILPEELFLEAVDKLVSIDREWIPDGDGSLYLRPFMFANEIFLGVKPSSDYLFIVIASSVGAYFKTDAPAVSVWVSHGIHARGAGRHGCREMRRQLRRQPAGPGRSDPPRLRPGRVPRRGRAALDRRAGRHEHLLRLRRRLDGHATAGRHDPARHHARVTASPWPTTRASRFARTAIRSTNGAPTPPAAASARPSPAARPPSSRRSARSAGKDGEFKIGNGGPGTKTEELKAALVGIQRGRAADPHGWIHKVF